MPGTVHHFRARLNPSIAGGFYRLRFEGIRTARHVAPGNESNPFAVR